MEKVVWSRIDRLAKKVKAINYLGGKCICCGEDSIFKLCFHHNDKNEKEENLNVLKYKRWTLIEKELLKCSLVCHNCHMKIHFQNGSDKNRRNINKKTFLKYKNKYKCERCGYDDNNSSLDFHHIDKDDKDFLCSDLSITYFNIEDLTNKIENELDKCIILCKNCHFYEHSDIEFYYKYKDLIIKKSLNIREIQPKIDRNKVKEMYESGMKQIEIAKYFNAGRGTISDIIKNLKNNEE